MIKKFKRVLIKTIVENGSIGLLIFTRKLINKLYSIIFLKQYGICSDYSSYISGLKYMSIGSMHVGRHCRIEMITEYYGTHLNPKLKIGKNVILNDMVHIGCANYIEIGDDCLFASRIYVSDHNHGSYKGELIDDASSLVRERNLDLDKPVIIGNNVWLGEGVSVLPGAKIGDNSIIGTNSVVIGEIPSDCIAAGIPAKVIKYYSKEEKAWIKKEINFHE